MKPRLRIAAALVIVLVAAFAGQAEARNPARAPAVSQLSVRYLPLPKSVAGGYMAEPAISGTTVAVAAQLPNDYHGRFRLYLGDIRNWKPRQLLETSLPETQIGLTAMSANWLTWVQFAGLGWSIYARSLHTGRQYLVDSSQRAGPMAADLYFPIVSVSGDEVAWSYVSCVDSCNGVRPRLTSAVMVRQLPFGRLRTVRHSYGKCVADWPSLSGNLVVFQMEGHCWGKNRSKVGSDVYAKDLASGRIWAVTADHGSSEPVTNGSYIAWKHGRPGSTRWTDGTIMLLDRRTGKRGAVSLRGAGKNHPVCWPKDTEIETCADQPEISNSLLEWTIDNGGTILIRNLHTGGESVFIVPIHSRHSPTRPLNVSGHRLVWRDVESWSNGNTRGSDLALGVVP